MSILPFNNPILSTRRKGDTLDPFIPLVQSILVKDNKVLLSEIPSQFEHVTVSGLDVTWTEIYKDLPNEDNFLVDYSMGLVYFHPSRNNSELQFTFKGTGCQYFPMGRVWTQSDGTTVTETLDEVVARAQDIVLNIDALESSILVAQNLETELDSDISTGNSLHSTLTSDLAAITPLANSLDDNIATATTKNQDLITSISNSTIAKSNLDGSISTSNQLKINLDSDISIGGTLHSNLLSDISTGDSLNTTLLGTTSSANSINSTLVSTNQTATNINNALILTNQAGIDTNLALISSNDTANITKSALDLSNIDATNTNILLGGTNATAIITNGTLNDSIIIGDSLKSDLNSIIPTGDTTVLNLNNSIGSATTIDGILQGTIVSANVSIDELNASNLAFQLIEVYDPLHSYIPLNKVTYQGSTYQCIFASTGNLPTNTTYFILIALAGTGAVSSVTSANTDISVATSTSTPVLTLNSANSGANKILKLDANGQTPATIILEDATHRYITDTEKSTYNGKQDALGFTPENVANKGVINGYSSLDANGKIPLSQIPDTAKQQTYIVLDSTARLALTNLISGDKSYETSTGDSYIWDGLVWYLLSDADWVNVSLDWTNISNKPTSSVANIDSAVTNSHTHSNKAVLDKITQTGIEAGFDLSDFVTSSELGAAGYGDMMQCYNIDTDILTERGFIKITQLNNFDTVATLNPIDNKIIYQPVKNIYRYDNVEHLYEISNQLIDLSVTLNHKMFVKRRNKVDFELIEARDIEGKRVEYKKDGIWEGVYKQFVEIENVSIPIELYAEFMGYYLSEGCTINAVNGQGAKDYLIAVSQVKDRTRDKMFEVTAEVAFLFGRNAFIRGKDCKVSDKRLYNYLFPFGKSYEKYIPKEIMNSIPKIIKIFLEAYIDGDGNRNNSCGRKTEKWNIFTTSVAMTNQLQELALKAGWSASISINTEVGNISYIKGREIISKHRCYTVAINKTKNTPMVNHGHTKTQLIQKESIVDYGGSVIGVEVEKYHTLYIRRNGKTVWSGNSTYDVLNSGVVDDSDKLGGQLPSYYETTTGAQTKANTAETNAKSYTDTQLLSKSDTTHNHTLTSLSEKNYSSLVDKPTLGTVASKDTGTTNGTIPIIGIDNKLDINILPSIALMNTFVVATEIAMLALSCQIGDICVRTDLSKSFILKVNDPTVLANWQELLSPTDLVQSVNGKTGTVTLTATDVNLGNVTNESKATMFTDSALTGTPTAPTASVDTDTTQVASTEFVKAQISNDVGSLSNEISVLNGSSALIMTSTQDINSRTTNVTYTRSDATTYKTIDYSNFDANNKPQTVVTKLYSSTSALETTNTATVVWSTDGTYVISSSEVMS